jgi:hypothetical protein
MPRLPHHAGPMGSLGRSIHAYQPYYAPPVTPSPEFINNSSPLAQQGLPGARIDQHTRLVNRMPRMLGIRWLYAYGGQVYPWFKMIATGQVESTKFQPIVANRWSGENNDAIYQAGYPRNLGFTFKVNTIPPAALGTAPWHMQPTPQFRGRPIFARRAYTSGIRGVPAQPQNGR